jgi:hypothetical protein
MIVCEIDRTWYKNNMTEMRKEIDSIQTELGTYKHEYPPQTLQLKAYNF